MSDQEKREAQEHAARAARQAKHAAKNAGRAAAEGAEYAADEVVETSKQAVRRFSPRGLAMITGDTGIGFLALSVSLYAGVIAFNSFHAAYNGRRRAVNP
jgi:hypothetical protein